MGKATIFFCLLILFCVHIVECATCDGTTFQIVDDETLSQILAEAKEEFLATRPTPVSSLQATILIPTYQNNQTIWRRGSNDPFVLSYPASTVKLGFMAASAQWCLDNGREADCLDSHVRPMIKDSDNLQTGIVVDICSGAPNINLTTTSSPLFQPWSEKRLWAMNYLSSYNLLGNQTISVKTYPTNTGQTLWGAEYLAWDYYGRNNMCTQCAASLMLEVTQAGLQKHNFPAENPYFARTKYFRGLLSHQPWSDETSLGFGVPPGTTLRNKIGVAYDNLNDIALIELPSGDEFIIAVYSTGYEPNQPLPYDGSNLGTFLEFVLDRLDYSNNPCSPPVIKETISSVTFSTTGTWSGAVANDAYGGNYLITSDSTASAFWKVNIPSSGLYEVCTWSPQSPTFTSSATVQVNSVTGSYNISVSQQNYGGRWYKLGDFYLNGGESNVVGFFGGSSVVANAIKLSKWPECNHSPGALCTDYDPSAPATCKQPSK